jgi:hypothetical protein
MKPIFSGQCLCGSIQFNCSIKPSFQANCHCDDCRKSGGSVYASFAFVAVESLKIIKGEPASFQHKSDRGSQMTKYFCKDCGSQLFTANSNFPERRGVRVGVIDNADWFQPMANVYTCKKLASTPLDVEVKAFDKMPI